MSLTASSASCSCGASTASRRLRSEDGDKMSNYHQIKSSCCCFRHQQLRHHIQYNYYPQYYFANTSGGGGVAAVGKQNDANCGLLTRQKCCCSNQSIAKSQDKGDAGKRNKRYPIYNNKHLQRLLIRRSFGWLSFNGQICIFLHLSKQSK